ncbi:MAG: PQQ-binding-like beta-propeller repeat protein [Candidatus Bathyarchaeia archaeon]
MSKKLAAALALTFIIGLVILEPATPTISPVWNSLLVSQLWSFTPPVSYQGTISTPIAVDGFVYFSANGDGPPPGTLYCLKGSTGEQVWSQTILNGYSSFTAANGYVYAGEGGAIACLSDSDGAQMWNYTYGISFGIPVVVGGTVYVDGSQINPISGFSGGFVLALNSSTGTKIWGYIGAAGPSFSDNLLVAGGNIYVHTYGPSYTNSFIYAFDALTGEQLWNSSMAGQISSFAADAQNLYVSSSGGSLYAFRGSDGSIIWHRSVGSSLGSVSVVNHYLFVGSSTGVYCFNAVNGALMWKFIASAGTDPTYANGIVYVGWSGPEFFASSTVHNLYAIEAFKGRELWSYSLAYTGETCTVEKGTVYVGAGYVTTLSPDNIGPGACLALKPIVTSLPLPSVTFWEQIQTIIIVIRIAAVTVLIIILVFLVVAGKKPKTNLQKISIAQKT